MSTRSLIGRQYADGTVRFIYCHRDGHPEGVGAVLRRHYREPDKVEVLLALGDLSWLGTEIKAPDYANDNPGQFCIAYGRDWDEQGCQVQAVASADAFFETWQGNEYWYLFSDAGRWLFTDECGECPRPLTELLTAASGVRPDAGRGSGV